MLGVMQQFNIRRLPREIRGSHLQGRLTVEAFLAMTVEGEEAVKVDSSRSTI